MANNVCRRMAGAADFDDLDLELLASRVHRPLRPLVAIERLCHARPTYDLWRHNAWIRAE